MPSDSRASWLPEHHLHVVATLAHVDGLVSRVGSMVFDYVVPPGPLEFDNVLDGDRVHVSVKAIAPLPEAVSRCVADALTQMRAAIEHVVYAEVEYLLGRALDEGEARRVEMPACTDHGVFERWLQGSGRPKLPPLRRGSPLVKRIEGLQPYHRRDADQHPLRVLAEHTNLVKHRTPAVAATRIGTVRPDHIHPGLEVHDFDEPLKPGDILASAPKGVVVPLSIWPTVSVQRPHTRTWHVLMHELGKLEAWVREVAIPLLIVGTRKVESLPPQLDITRGQTDLRAALGTAGVAPAAKRAEKRLSAVLAREGLLETLAVLPRPVDENAIRGWVESLDDEAVLERWDRFVRASALSGRRALAEADRFLGDVLVHGQRVGE